MAIRRMERISQIVKKPHGTKTRDLAVGGRFKNQPVYRRPVPFPSEIAGFPGLVEGVEGELFNPFNSDHCLLPRGEIYAGSPMQRSVSTVL
jgi:hypothetical protein